MGFGIWGATSALLAGLAAKEIIVSSIAMFNGISVSADSMKDQTMRSIIDSTSVVFFTPASALSFMVFCLLYAPCLPTISAFRKEIGKKWTFIAIVIQLLIAYILSLFLYNIFKLIELWGALNVVLCFFAVFIIVLSFFYVLARIKNKKYCNYNCSKCYKCKRDK